MPDHLRKPKNAMGPRSPAGSDSPLSLVIGSRMDHSHHLIHNKTPPPPLIHEGSGSSGFSEESSLSPQTVQEKAVEDQPLSLVVPKRNYDSGLETETENSRSPQTKELKIKDFAKFQEAEKSSELMAALTSGPQINGPGPSKKAEDQMSEISDLSSFSDLIQAQKIGDHIVYPCEFCDKVFGNKYHLASHLVTHTGERSFECKLCQKSFGRRSTLRAHMTTHTKMSNFMCPLCEKACNDNNSLEEHIRMHTGEKPFVCTICSKAYARKSHLNVHYRVHTGERPFVCMSCGKDFTEKRFLNDHMQTAHSGNDGPLKCPNCFREFAYKTSLKQHLKKQMCAKNLNRGQPNQNQNQANSGNQGNSGNVHAKQFACPFCEKSYSWKQTLKQHVSMYHRNKVHTDEFWKYELAKHRRTVLDSKTNEDMWRKQLGKHADETELEESLSRSRSLEIHDRSKQPDDRWLEQIKRSTSTDPGQNSQVSQEMKLLALQSLQTSLQMMSMKKPTLAERPQTSESPPKSQPTEGGYLTLLAHLSAQRKASESSEIPPYLSEMKEESAAKRTQMWLQQLGAYRQKSHFSESDLTDRNHDELWEEQIAKVKKSPIKSPLEPIEITIEDQEEKAVLPPPLAENKIITLKTSQIQRVHTQPRTFSLTLEVNNNEQRPHIPVALAPTRNTSQPLLEIPQEIDEEPVLKSLLMGKLPRKRPLSPPVSEKAEKAKRLSVESSDILRRRLLGIKEEQEIRPTAEIRPKFQPPSATITSQELEGPPQNGPVDLRKSEQPVKKNYTQTSVLKHLLYRYNNEEQNS